MSDPMTAAERAQARRHVDDIHACYSHLRNASPNLRRIVRLWDEVERLRAELEEYRASDRRLRDLAQQALDDKNAAAAQATNRYAALHAERDRLRAELARWEGHDAVTATLVKQAEAERDAARKALASLQAKALTRDRGRREDDR